MKKFNVICNISLFVMFCWTLLAIDSSLIAFVTLLVEYALSISNQILYGFMKMQFVIV